MQIIRRAAFRAVSSPATAFISKPRAITTSSPFALRSKLQSGIAPSVFRRYASDEAESSEPQNSDVESADNEPGSVTEAIDSTTESAANYAQDAAESLTSNAEQVEDRFADAAESLTSNAEQAEDSFADVAESLTSNVEQAKDSIVDAAAGAAAAAGIGYQPREDRRESKPYNGRHNDASYNDRRGYERDGYGGRGGDRDGYVSRGDRGLRRELKLDPNNGIYIGNILFDITEEDLKREFGEFGPMTRVTIATDSRGLSKGFGYVNFETTEQATAAIEAKHQSVLEGRRLVVNYQVNTKREAKVNLPSKTLFIGNLAFEMSDADLNKLFRDIRNVIDVRVAIDRRTGQPRGFAHADFTDVESAVEGKKALFDQEFYGRTLRVDFSGGRQPATTSDVDGNGQGGRGFGGELD